MISDNKVLFQSPQFAVLSETQLQDLHLAALEILRLAKLIGANLVHDVGYIESGLTTSFEMIVLTDELVAMTGHLMKGIEVSEETLMLDEVDQVGPGGHFLDTDQTLNRFRDFWFPGLLDRRRRPEWLEAGSPALGQRLNARVNEIIKEHRPKPLGPEKKRVVGDILATAKG